VTYKTTADHCGPVPSLTSPGRKTRVTQHKSHSQHTHTHWSDKQVYVPQQKLGVSPTINRQAHSACSKLDGILPENLLAEVRSVRTHPPMEFRPAISEFFQHSSTGWSRIVHALSNRQTLPPGYNVIPRFDWLSKRGVKSVLVCMFCFRFVC
jgi:hypothetical protein